MQKPDVDEIDGLSPAISIDQKTHSANPRSTVATMTEIYDYLRVAFARLGRPHCPVCGEVIQKLSTDEMVKLISGKRMPVTILAPVVLGRKGNYYQLLYDLYNSGFAKVRIDGQPYNLSERIELRRYAQHTIEVVVDEIRLEKEMSGEKRKEHRQRLSEAIEVARARGNGLVGALYADKTEQILSSKFSCPKDGFSFPEIEPRLFSFNSPYGACPACTGLGTKELFSEEPCPVCQGARLKKESLAVKLQGLSIADVTRLSIDRATEYFLQLSLTEQEQEIARMVLKEIQNRLTFLLDVGLHYLTLNRISGTLSGGEAQRIRLASQVGTRLVGALYVLDEPTVGLHQRDNAQLIRTLQELRNLGNTVIVVEHDEEMIRASDYMLEIGPGAGTRGGTVVAAGTVPNIFQDPHSLTAAYLRGDKAIPLPDKRRRVGNDVLKVLKASANNLAALSVNIPLRRFVCVTGVSGSGKSTLVHDVLYRALAKKLYGAKSLPGKHQAVLGVEYLDKLVLVDQSSIGRTPRSNPATYTGAWMPIRELFATTPEARFRGYKSGRFSFNVAGGRCEACEGHGEIAIEMHFLPTVYVTCEVCRGKRFSEETLEITWKEKTIYNLLQMTIEEAGKFFEDIPPVYDKLQTLNEVGLGYLQLGQGAPTLSGGEAQRVKLAAELSKRQTGRTLYVLDEPTTGLHFEDVKRLLEVLHALVDRGNSVIVIEHNLDVIKTADWVIDLGPEGGERGGRLVAEGTPEDIARSAKSFTGAYVRKVLGN
jgi:excinuclease ABC subunit A